MSSDSKVYDSKDVFDAIEGRKWDDISIEEYREYTFPGGEVKRITGVLKLNVSPSGGHRLLLSNGMSCYIPPRWIMLQWQPKPGQPNFIK